MIPLPETHKKVLPQTLEEAESFGFYISVYPVLLSINSFSMPKLQAINNFKPLDRFGEEHDAEETLPLK